MLDNDLWFVLLEGTALFVVIIGTAYIFYPVLTANTSVARNNGLEVVRTRRDIAANAGTGCSRDSASEKNPSPSQQRPQQRPLLTVIVPAYNEELRLVIMLQEAYEYLSASSSADVSSSTASQQSKSTTAPSTKEKTCRALQLLQEAVAAASTADTSSSTNAENHKTDEAIIVEWILVNDGSTDDTCRVYRDWVQQLPSSSSTSSTTISSKTNTNTKTKTKHIFQLLSLQPNAGKGAAVQAGMLAATGDYRLMVDADGATEFGSGLLALAMELNKNVSDTDETLSAAAAAASTAAVRPEFLLGSRAHMDDADSRTTTPRNDQQGQPPNTKTNATVNRSIIRRALSYLFHKFCVTLIGAGDIRDTQCGFKLLTAAAADKLFGNLHLKRWAFDTEIIFLSARLLIPMREVAVVWTEVDGSKLHTGGPFGLAVVAVSMLRDMICVRLCYTLGIWKIIATTPTASNTKSKFA